MRILVFLFRVFLVYWGTAIAGNGIFCRSTSQIGAGAVLLFLAAILG